MSKQRAHDLAQVCKELARGRDDVPNIWTTCQVSSAGRRHPTVQIMSGRAVLEVRLITGERRLFDGDARRFSLG